MSGQLLEPETFLRECRMYQDYIDRFEFPHAQNELGAEAVRLLDYNPYSFVGTKLELHTLRAFGLPDELTADSEVFPVVSLDEMRLRGHLAGVAYIYIHNIRTLAWTIADPLIRQAMNDGPSNEGARYSIQIGETDTILRRPLYLPVSMIESVLIAA